MLCTHNRSRPSSRSNSRPSSRPSSRPPSRPESPTGDGEGTGEASKRPPLPPVWLSQVHWPGVELDALGDDAPWSKSATSEKSDDKKGTLLLPGDPASPTISAPPTGRVKSLSNSNLHEDIPEVRPSTKSHRVSHRCCHPRSEGYKHALLCLCYLDQTLRHHGSFQLHHFCFYNDATKRLIFVENFDDTVVSALSMNRWLTTHGTTSDGAKPRRSASRAGMGSSDYDEELAVAWADGRVAFHVARSPFKSGMCLLSTIDVDFGGKSQQFTRGFCRHSRLACVQ